MFLSLSLGYLFFFLTEVFEISLMPGSLLYITRPFFSILSALLVYYALIPRRIEPYKPKLPKKDKLTIFISYATIDAVRYNIQELAIRLKSFEEIESVLFYETESYDNFVKYMNENIGKCDALLLFCSENALNSTYVENEWTAAESLNKPIIPVFHDPKHIPPLLTSRLGVNYDLHNMEGNVQKIRNVINRRLI